MIFRWVFSNFFLVLNMLFISKISLSIKGSVLIPPKGYITRSCHTYFLTNILLGFKFIVLITETLHGARYYIIITRAYD